MYYDRDSKLDKFLRFTECAELLFENGIGRYFETFGDIIDLKPEIISNGLLMLILDGIRKSRERVVEFDIGRHSSWLERGLARHNTFIAAFDKQCYRLQRMFGNVDLGIDLEIPYMMLPMNAAGLYRTDFSQYFQERSDFERQIDRLKSVKKKADVMNLHGIGKVAAKRILG